MKIHLSVNTAGRGGGGLKGDLRYLPAVIQSGLDNSGFTSTFEELWLTLSYPPLYVLPGVVGIETSFYKGYALLPTSRINKRLKRISVDLKAPELSEHFDLKDQENYLHRFNVESQYTNISDLDLAKILVDKYLEAGEIIASKLKAQHEFNYELFRSTLQSLKQKITEHFLTKALKEEQIKSEGEVLKRAMIIREERRKNQKPKNKIVRDVRIHYYGTEDKLLYPYDYQYVEIFRNLLRRGKLLCPGYDHLYVQAVPSFDEGLRKSFSLEPWYVNGIAVFDFNSFSNKTESDKELTIIDLISAGLNDIAIIDGLDISIIEQVVSKVRNTGLDTELVYNSIENSNYLLTITYFSRSMEEKCPLFFHVLDKKTGRSSKIEVGRVDNNAIYFWLQKITLTRNQIKVKSSTSMAADFALSDLPRSMEFDIERILSI